jgi:hypothetical protein
MLCSFLWTSGTNHTIATAATQQVGSGTQLTFANWSDGGAMSHTITAAAGVTYTANFTAQYYLTTVASPAAGGTITPASGWYNPGAVVSVSEQTNAGYQFSGFSGALSGTQNGQSVTMNAAESVTATFTGVPTITSISQSGAQAKIEGSSFGTTGTVTFGGVAATILSWSSAEIVATIPGAGGTQGVSVAVTVPGFAPVAMMFAPAAPSITLLSMNSGPPQMGFVITGTQFGDPENGAATPIVTLNGANLTVLPNPNGWGPTFITVQIPAGTAATPVGQTWNLVVNVPGGGSSPAWPFTVTGGFGCGN